jgi:hypothetical protein
MCQSDKAVQINIAQTRTYRQNEHITIDTGLVVNDFLCLKCVLEVKQTLEKGLNSDS